VGIPLDEFDFTGAEFGFNPDGTPAEDNPSGGGIPLEQFDFTGAQFGYDPDGTRPESPWGEVLAASGANMVRQFGTAGLGIAQSNLEQPNRGFARLQDRAAQGGTLSAFEAPGLAMELGGGLLRRALLGKDTFEQVEDYRQGLVDTVSGEREEINAIIEASRPQVNDATAKYFVGAALESVGPTASAVLGTLITRNPNVGLSIMGGQVYGAEYGKRRDEGRSIAQANQDGIFSALAEAIPERIPLGILTREGGKFFSRVGKGALAEGLQETFTSILQKGYDLGIVDENTTWAEAREAFTSPDFIKELRDALIIGNMMGGGLAAVTHPLANVPDPKGKTPPPSRLSTGDREVDRFMDEVNAQSEAIREAAAASNARRREELNTIAITRERRDTGREITPEQRRDTDIAQHFPEEVSGPPAPTVFPQPPAPPTLEQINQGIIDVRASDVEATPETPRDRSSDAFDKVETQAATERERQEAIAYLQDRYTGNRRPPGPPTAPPPSGGSGGRQGTALEEPASPQASDTFNVDETRGTYPTGTVKEDVGGEDASVPGNVVKAQRDANFRIRYEQVETGQLRSGTDTITNYEDAAHVFAPLRKHAQEMVMAAVTDADGKILHVIKHSKGIKDESPVSPLELAAAIGSTPGAVNVWMGHAHPTGNPTPSKADQMITGRMVRALEGSGVRLQGHVVVGEGTRASALDGFGMPDGDISTRPDVRRHALPVTERLLRRRLPNQSAKIQSPQDAQQAVADAGLQSGVLLTDNQHRPLAALAMTSEEMTALRENKQVPRLLKALDTTNAAAGIVVAESDKAGKNLGNYLSRLAQFRHLDTLVREPDGRVRSLGEYGQDLSTPGEEKPFFSRRDLTREPFSAPIFFSQLERTLAERMGKRANAKDLASMIRAWVRKGDVKQEEVDEVGILRWLDEQEGRVTKAEMLELMKVNQVTVEEITKTGPDEADLESAWIELEKERYDTEYDEDEGGYVIFDENGEVARGFGGDLLVFNDEEDARGEIYGIVHDRSENMSDAEMRRDLGYSDTDTNTQYDRYTEPGGEDYTELLLTLPDNVETFEKNNHYDEPNVVVHVRFKTRKGADGGKVLFVEELQSDWHQAGRKGGYTPDEAALKALKEEADRLDTEVHRIANGAPGGRVANLPRKEKMAFVKLSQQAHAADEALERAELAPPPAPFKKTWPLLAMKRMLRYAVDNNFDRVAWTTGAQQADRYSLRKKINQVALNGSNFEAFDHNGYSVLKRTGVTLEDLPELIGQELTDRLMAKEPEGTLRTLTDLELETGGEGMKGFYDQILPKELGKYLKRFGGKVDTSEVNLSELALNPNDTAEYQGHFAAAMRSQQPGFDITDKMRALAPQGQPLFRREGQPEPTQPAPVKTAAQERARGTTETDRPVDHQALPALRRAVGRHLGQPVKTSDLQAVSAPVDSLAQRIAALFGKEVVVVRNRTRANFNATVIPSQPNVLFVEQGALDNAVALTGHELMHQLREEHPELYEVVRAAAEAEIQNHAEYKQRLEDAVRRETGDPTATVTDDFTTEEILADFMGDAFTRPGFWKQVANENPTRFQEIADYVLDFLKQVIAKLKGVKGLDSARYVRDIAKVQKVVADAVAQYAEGKGTPRQGAAKFARKKKPKYKTGQLISGRFPTRGDRTEDQHDPTLQVSLEAMKRNKEAFRHNMVKVAAKYPLVRSKSRSPDKIAAELKDAVVENLLWLHDQMPAALRERAKQWYVGANRIANEFAERFDVSVETAAGVMAALSPQTPWQSNISLAERVLDTVNTQMDTKWTRAMTVVANKRPVYSRPQNAVLYTEAKGKTLREAMELDPRVAAVWLRAYDEANHDQHFRDYSPEGDVLDWMRTNKGAKASAGWGGFGEIAKALSVIQDPTRENISTQMGNQHKVRNFYNNIVDPNDTGGAVTIDTHAIAAAHLRPFGGTDAPVLHNFATSPGKDKRPPRWVGTRISGESGAQGLYGLYADAYREAADQLGILPRELQSIAWEAVKGLYNPGFKTPRNKQAVADTWTRYNKGEIDLDTAHQELLGEANGIAEPTWAGSDYSDNETTGVSADKGKLRRTVVGPGQGNRPRAGGADTVRSADRRTKSASRKSVAKKRGGKPKFSRKFSDTSAEQESLLGKIGQSEITTLKQRWQHFTERLGERIRQGVVDKYAPLLKIDKALYGGDVMKSPDITSSGYALARMAESGGGALLAMMRAGRIYYDKRNKVIDVNTDAPGLMELLERLGSPKEIDRFMAWVAAHRSNELMAQGREHLFTAEEIAGGMTLDSGTNARGEARGPLYASVKTTLDVFKNDVMAIAAESGIVDKEWSEAWQNDWYVPFYRIMDDDVVKGPKVGSSLKPKDAFKKLKGGKENLNDLLENTLINFNHLLSQSLRNTATRQALENAAEVGIAEKTTETKRDRKNSTYYFENGKKVWYNVEDPLVFNALTMITTTGMNNAFMRTARSFKRVFTNFVTASPQFILRNAIRDSMHSIAVAKELNYNFAGNVASGIKAYGIGDVMTDTRAHMLSTGGGFSFGHIYGEHVDDLKYHITKERRTRIVVRDAESALEAMHSVVRLGARAFDKYHALSDTAENANRATLFNTILRDEDGAKLRAAYESRNLLDFAKHGSFPLVRFLVETVPFLNARLQGLARLEEAWDNPKSRARFAIVIGAMSMASIVLRALNADNDDYNELEEWDKDASWHIFPSTLGMDGDWHIVIPKPFEVGAIATMAERGFELIMKQTGDEKYQEANAKLFAQRIKHTIAETLAFDPTPQIVAPLLDVWYNKDGFTGREIESLGMQLSGISPVLRSRASTTTAAKHLSEAMNATIGQLDKDLVFSPVQVDYMIRNYLGWVGTVVAGGVSAMTDAATGTVRPQKYFTEYQPMRSFYRDEANPGYSKYMTQFYDLNTEIRGMYADMKALRADFRPEEAAIIAEKNPAKLAMRLRFGRAQRAMSKARKRMKRIQQDQTLSAATKRKRVDEIRTRLNAISEQVVKQLQRRQQAAEAYRKAS
jgi:hypothetical protein